MSFPTLKHVSLLVFPQYLLPVLMRIISSSLFKPNFYKLIVLQYALPSVCNFAALVAHHTNRDAALPDPQTRRETLDFLRSDLERLRQEYDLVCSPCIICLGIKAEFYHRWCPEYSAIPSILIQKARQTNGTKLFFFGQQDWLKTYWSTTANSRVNTWRGRISSSFTITMRGNTDLCPSQLSTKVTSSPWLDI